MSELFMECEEEELEPWQIQVPQINLVDDNDDDDELIFVGELSSANVTIDNGRPTNNQSNVKTIPVQTAAAGRPEANRMPLTPTSNVQSLNPQPTLGVGQPLSQSITVAAQPIIINNQGYFVSSPQLSNNSTFITSLGKQYPPGTSFTIVPAGQQQFLPQLAPSNPTPGVVHRPQVQQISKNVVTLSNVQSPAAFSQTPAQASRLLPQPVQIVSGPIKAQSTNKDNNSVKRSLPPDQNESTVKRSKTDVTGSTKAGDQSENGTFKLKCPKCREQFFEQEVMKIHMKACCPHLVECLFPGKRIMLVKDFYYGRHEGDGLKQQGIKTNTTFKCQSCLKVLKNNVRFMNHMKHHLELEKQNSESWESHTTCQHCYRQYTTPFQLQCHIESAHSPYESSTNCKICELAFESEQVLLEHMKDNHKPGEMPYMCQVCNYRSSFFSEVETHFRSVHENTKDLLCPFCLKVLRTGHVYMQHYMKHQRKGIHRCGKCRLNFLTYKERVDHKLHFHKTFKKPTALEGLPPGTKVTIRASFTGPVPTSPSIPKSVVSVVTDVQGAQKYTQTQANAGPKSKSAKQKEKATKKKENQPKKNNKALKNLRYSGGKHTCIECETTIDNFVSHYPSVVTCGACKYRTSCKVSIGNHMIRFHSTIKDKYKRMDRRRIPPVLKGLTLVCLNCDLLVDASESDRMTKHLTDRPHHVCKVIEERSTPKSSLFSRADSGKREHVQQLQATNKILLLRFPPNVKPAVQSVPSTTGGEGKEVGQAQNLQPKDDVILIDDETTAQQPADAAKQGSSAIDLTQEDTAATPMEGLVVGDQGKEESGPRPPSPPVTCEIDEGAVRLDESPNKLGSMGVDIGEQARSPPELRTTSVSLGDESMGTVPPEASSLVSESPAEDDLNPPEEGCGLPSDKSPSKLGLEVGEQTCSPPEPHTASVSLGDETTGTVPAEASPLITDESPTEDDLNPPEEGCGLPSDKSPSKLGLDVGEQTCSPPEPHTASVSLGDETTGTVPAEASPLITDESPTEDDLNPPEEGCGMPSGGSPSKMGVDVGEQTCSPPEPHTASVSLEDETTGAVPAEASPLITDESPTEDDLLPAEGSGKPSSLDQQKDSAAVE